MNSKSKKKVISLKEEVKVIDSPENVVDFDVWFWSASKEGRVQSHQQRELKVFFIENGLKHKDLKSRYEEILKQY